MSNPFAGAQQIVPQHIREAQAKEQYAMLTMQLFGQFSAVSFGSGLNQLAQERKEWREKHSFLADQDIPKEGEEGGPPTGFTAANPEVVLAMAQQFATVACKWLDTL